MSIILGRHHVSVNKTFKFITEIALGTFDHGWVALHALGNALAVYLPRDDNNLNNASLLLYDITSPLAPALKSNTGAGVVGATAPGTAKIIGTNLYLATNGKFGVWDISNLLSPISLGNLLLTSTNGMPHAFELSGSIYSAAQRVVGLAENVSVYNETVPSSITLSGATGDLVVGGNFNCGYGTTFYAPNDVPDTMYIVDCSTPSTPSVASTIALTSAGDISSASAGALFFQRSTSGFIRAYNVTDITSPSFGSEFKVDSLDASPFATGSFTDGSFLYSTNFGTRSSVTIQDVANLTSVVEVGNLLTQHDPFSSNPICAIGSAVYVVTNDGAQNFLEVYQFA